jgi:Gluconate 2-dehydrogenase subunit 3
MPPRTPPPDVLGERGAERRQWLRLLVGGGVITVVGGAVGLVRTGGYALDSEVRAKLQVLAPWQYVVLRAVARRMVAPDRPDAPSPDDVGVAEFVDAYLVEMRPAVRRDFLRMLRFTEQLAPLGSGLLGRFSDLSADDQDGVLARLESSRIGQLRAGFQALKSLVMMGYYRDPRTFRMLQYAGPLIAPVEEMPR